jgi:hypothetical protein
VARFALPAVLLVTLVMITPLCGLSFDCGCQALWSGAADHCNVNRAGEPHCPWCEFAVLGSVGVGLTLVIQVAGYRLLRRRGAGTLLAALVALVLMTPASIASAALTWLATDYPHLVEPDLRSRLGVPSGPFHCGG